MVETIDNAAFICLPQDTTLGNNASTKQFTAHHVKLLKHKQEFRDYFNNKRRTKA